MDNGSYAWPEKEDKSTEQTAEILKISSPDEEIVSAASYDVRVKLTFKLTFNSGELNAARLKFDCCILNSLR